jgi:hypothetical protein
VRRGPHPFFWLAMVFALLGGLAAWSAEPLAPSFALKSVMVYRIEVALSSSRRATRSSWPSGWPTAVTPSAVWSSRAGAAVEAG